VIYLADKLDDWVATIRQWYSPFLTWAGPILLLFAFGLAVYIAFRVTQFYPYDSQGKGVALIVGVLIAVGTVELSVLKLFPRGTFAIGNGEKRHQVLTYVRNTVLVGLGLSVIGSVIANWIIRRP
jgi:purine-cytosine permease-like protein